MGSRSNNRRIEIKVILNRHAISTFLQHCKAAKLNISSVLLQAGLPVFAPK